MRNHERSCVGCIHNNGVPVVVVGDEPCWTCLPTTVDLPNYEEELPQKRLVTNADRIRSMTDEELADFLDRWALGDIDYSQTFCSLCKGQYDCRDDCLLGWLKQEAE